MSTGIDTALDKYSQVILSIIEQINSKSDAVIIIQTLYDPFAKVPAAFMFQGLSKDKIEKKDLFNIAKNVIESDLTKYNNLTKEDKREFIVNPYYCTKYNVSKKVARNIAKKELKNDKTCR